MTDTVSGLRRAGGKRRRLLLRPILAVALLALALVPSAQSVHDLGLFELDRNAVDNSAAGLPDDWGTLFAGGGSATRFTGILNDTGTPGNQFQAGGSKDNNDITQWLWKAGEPLDKDDITNAYAAAYINTRDTGNNNVGDLIIYYGLDRFANNGSAQVGFWFFQNDIGLTNIPTGGGFQFSGVHAVGDVLVQSNFSQGGVIDSISVFAWVGSGGSHGALNLLFTAQDCVGPPATAADDPACATVNRATESAPWSYTPKFPDPANPTGFPQGSFFEGGINISRLVPGAGCFSDFLAETRTSTPFDARLKDFALGSFELCDVEVDKTGDALSKVGDPADYTITIRNTGAVTIFKDDITDTLLGPITVNGVDQVNPFVTGNTCGASLAPNTTCTITATRTVQAGDPDPLPNTVSITYRGEADLSGAAIADTDDHSVNLFQPSVEVVKGGDTLSKVGDEVTYDFTITNTSSADSPNLVLDSISDTLLGDLTGAASPVECDNLAPSASCSFSVNRTVQAGDSDPLPNTVTVHYHPAGFPNDITDDDSHEVNLFQPSVTIDKTGDELSKVGDPVNYTITVTNTSSTDSPNLSCRIQDPLLGLDKTVELAPGASDVSTPSREVQPGDPDPLVNTATADCTVLGGFGNVLDTVQDSHSVNLFQPSVEVVKGGDTLSKVGDEVTYDFTITNTSSADSPNLVLDSISDTLLGDLTGAASPVECDNLAPSASCSFSVNRTVQAGDSDPLPNTVTVHYHPAGFPNDITDDDSHEVNLFQPSVTIDKTGDELSKVGDPVNYTITVTNTSSTDSPNLSCRIQDPLLGLDKTVELAPGASDVSTPSREVQPGDPDPLVNTATADCTVLGGFGNVLDTVQDSHSVNLFQPSVEVIKTGPATAIVGQTITYNFTINNTSSADSPNLVLDSITDTILGDLTGAQSPPACDTLATPGGSCSFGVNYTVQQSDPDPLVNVVTVHYHPAGFPNDITDTDDHSLEVERELAQLAHTQTTCEEFITQTGDAVPPLTELTYGLRSDGTIGNVSPGVFFFYASYSVTGSQGALTVDAAERFNAAVGPLTNDFVVQQDQAFLYSVSNNTCTRLQANVTTSINGGQVVITFDPPGNVPTGTYVLGIKYQPADSLIGQQPCHGLGAQCRYFFVPSRDGVEETARATSLLFRQRT